MCTPTCNPGESACSTPRPAAICYLRPSSELVSDSRALAAPSEGAASGPLDLLRVETEQLEDVRSRLAERDLPVERDARPLLVPVLLARRHVLLGPLLEDLEQQL